MRAVGKGWKVPGMMLFGVAVAIGILSWWLTGRLASESSPFLLLDHPNERSLHQRPTPRTGGVAVMASLFVGAFVCWILAQISSVQEGLSLLIEPAGWMILAATCVLSVVSLVDDRKGLPVSLRLGIQLVVSAVLVIGSSLRFPPLAIPLVGSIQWGWLAVPLAVLMLVWMANLYNFMDGMDGFAGGMTVIGGGGLAYIAWTRNSGTLGILALFLAAAALGFLAYNFPPAKIFLGDVGSIPVGFIYGALMLLGSRDKVFEVWVPVILFSPFIVDATVTVIRRALRGENIWQAHRSHYYQRAVLLGWGHRKTVLAEYVLMILCGVLACGFQMADDRTRLVILGCWGLLMGVAMGGVHRAEQSVARAGMKV